MKQNEPEKSHFKEYKFLYISGILFVSVISAYFLQFSSAGIGSQGVWGQFGDFMGGVLNPLLSFIVIWILVEDLGLTRIEIKNSLDEQKNATEAMKAQVNLLRPKANLACFLSFLVTRTTSYSTNTTSEGLVCVRFKNIGTAPIFNLKFGIPTPFNMVNKREINVLYPQQVLDFPFHPCSFEELKIGDSGLLGNFRILKVAVTYSCEPESKENEMEIEYTFNKSDIIGLSIN